MLVPSPLGRQVANHQTSDANHQTSDANHHTSDKCSTRKIQA